MLAPDGDPDQQPIEYQPVGVTELLSAMKDTSELLVDLAYSALLHNSPALAEEVLVLESRMDRLQLQARMNLLLAARNPTNARQLAPVLGIVGATEKVSEAAGDIATIVLDETALVEAIRGALPEAVEVLARAELASDSPYAGRTLGAIDVETETGVRVIATRRDDDWAVNPDAATTLTPGTVVLLRGAAEPVAAVYKTVTGDSYDCAADDTGNRTDTNTGTGSDHGRGHDHDIADLDRAVDSIVLMKDTSELAVDLAYASVLLDDESLAQEVRSLEVEIDTLQSRLETWTLRAAGDVADPASLRGLLGLADSAELISDAALEIAEGILRDIETHPVIAESVRESEVAVRRLELSTDSPLADSTVAAVTETAPGVAVIAIRRADGDWLFYPDAAVTTAPGDTVIVRGTWTATDELLAAV
ncbi:MAG: hypothetical protein J07HX5_01154 [halophilic archaeon J07HX5]|nr:MAG: hypothetical protein J07HX5_01154 [halophilic archaeon J07HX5]